MKRPLLVRHVSLRGHEKHVNRLPPNAMFERQASTLQPHRSRNFKLSTVLPMIMSGMSRRCCLPRSISRPARVCTECKPRHRHQEFLAFLRRLDDCIPPDLDVHLIVDNYATTSIPTCASGWPSGRGITCTTPRPTPSWLNQVERWFALITQRAIRRGSFRSVKDLIEKV